MPFGSRSGVTAVGLAQNPLTLSVCRGLAPYRPRGEGPALTSESLPVEPGDNNQVQNRITACRPVACAVSV